MRTKFLLIGLAFFVFSSIKAQTKYKVDWDYSGLSFKEFVIKTEAVCPVKFFFDEDWINDLKLGEYSVETTVPEILDDLLKGLSIYYIIDDAGNIILTKNYIVKTSDLTEGNEQNYIPTTIESESPENQKLSENLIVEIGNPADRSKPGNVTISGYVKDTNTREIVSGATVYIQKISVGTVTNEYGFYSLSVPRGFYLIQYSFIGMTEKKINLNLFADGELNVDLASVLVPLKETIITAQKNMMLERNEVGLEKINIVSFKLLPSAMGESDITKNLLSLPGVKSVGEGSAGFNVRGGAGDQNLILLYGAPVYNASHFFGFFSAINSDIIKDVSLYKGGIPARYGGRISSVLDIVSKDGDKRKFGGNAGISPITTHIMFEGPVVKDKISFLFTARSTYSNWILDLINDPYIQNSTASFHDLNGRIVYDINKNNKLELSSYTSYDSFRFNSDSTYKYYNNILSFRWRHFFNSRFFSFFSLNNSNYSYNISGLKESSDGFILSHKINSTNFKADFNIYPGSRNEINFGLDIISYNILPGSNLPDGEASLVVPRVIEREKAFEGAVYIDDKFEITNSLSVSIGSRLSTFLVLGPNNVRIYYPDFAMNKSTISDTLNFPNNKVYKTYTGPEFRMSWNLRMTDNSSIKLNYNRTRQYLHLLSNTTSISPTDTWKLSDYYLKPQIGDQFAAGYYRMWFKNRFESSAEIYYKVIKNLIDYKGGANLVMNQTIEQDIINVRGKAYGVELMVKKIEGKLRWSIGYTYSRVFIKSISNISEEIINTGHWFPANFDKPNDLNITLYYLCSRRISFSSNYTYSTGRPITYPVSIYSIKDQSFTFYSDRNKYRIPDYSRLDLSVGINSNLKSKRIAHPHWSFSVYNVLGRQNVYSIYFRNEDDGIKGYKLSVFARAIPSIVYSLDF